MLYNGPKRLRSEACISDHASRMVAHTCRGRGASTTASIASSSESACSVRRSPGALRRARISRPRRAAPPAGLLASRRSLTEWSVDEEGGREKRWLTPHEMNRPRPRLLAFGSASTGNRQLCLCKQIHARCVRGPVDAMCVLVSLGGRTVIF